MTVSQAEAVHDMPDRSETGFEGPWRIATKEFDRTGGTYSFNGIFLGIGSSQKGGHEHPPDEFPKNQGEKCGACRWTEVRLYRLEGAKLRYIVHVAGRSSIPGERQYYKIEYVDEPELVVMTLTTRRGGQPHIGHVGMAVLQRAADFDDEIRVLFQKIPVK